jgi:hypothetical protein
MSATALTPVAARAADAVLSGTIKSADGAVLGGATVSARLDGSNIVTSVFTDESGNYYFPPLASGKYKVWAQAITFDTGRGEVNLSAAKPAILILTYGGLASGLSKARVAMSCCQEGKTT